MDWSIVLGIAGILVSIGVGWLTYRLANKRAMSQRYAAAKATVLQSLSKSLGEDAIPTTDVLQATIRSVLRESGDPKLKLEIDDVLDDLIRQVTSDAFLDSSRRRKLQEDIQNVRSAATKSEPLRDYDYGRFSYLRSSTVPLFFSAVATLATVVLVFLAAATQKSSADVDAFFKANPWFGVLLAGGVAVIFIAGAGALLARLVDEGFLDTLRSFFRRRRH